MSPNPLIILALSSALLSLVFLVLAGISIKKRKVIATTLSVVTALLMLSLAALFSTITIAIAGYQALTKEELAATVMVEPSGVQQFTVRIAMPGGVTKQFLLAGDQLYIDAHILKWKPFANILGMHTSYELDRVAGRYADVNEERTKPHTVFSLSQDKPANMFDLRRRFAWLDPLLDAEYGSATFISAGSPEEFKVMVSTTGLLIRKSEAGAANAPQMGR